MRRFAIVFLGFWSMSIQAYMVEVLGTSYEIDPLIDPSGRTASQFYSYSNPYGAASNTPWHLEQSNTLVTFLYDGPNGLSLFLMTDIFQDADGGVLDMAITSTGLAGNGTSFIVRNDPGDSSYAWNDTDGSANPYWRWWPCCNDGFVLGYLPENDNGGNPTDYSWTIDLSFLNYSGFNQLAFYTHNEGIPSNPTYFNTPVSTIRFSYDGGLPVPEPSMFLLLFLSLASASLLGRTGRSSISR